MGYRLSLQAIGRFDGLDPMIMWAVGGVTGEAPFYCTALSEDTIVINCNIACVHMAARSCYHFRSFYCIASTFCLAAGHSAIAVHDPSDGQLYVAESTDVNPFGKAYWVSEARVMDAELSRANCASLYYLDYLIT